MFDFLIGSGGESSQLIYISISPHKWKEYNYPPKKTKIKQEQDQEINIDRRDKKKMVPGSQW